MIVGIIFVVFGVAFLSVVGYFAGGIGSWLSRQPSIADKLRWLTGAIFIGLGLRLAFIERE